MQYERTKNGLIQASIAHRLGVVLKQYYECQLDEEKFEVSLTLAILQNLLTNCIELFNSLSGSQRKENPLTNELVSHTSTWGISSQCVTTHTFDQGKLTYEKVFRHLRNALSHPTELNLESEYLSTGYTTDLTSRIIDKVIFVSSPDVNGRNSQIRRYRSLDEAQQKKSGDGTFPKDVEIVAYGDKYQFSINSKPFIRVCRIELTPMQLLNLTYALSSYLSHPLQRDWDGNFKIKKLAA